MAEFELVGPVPVVQDPKDPTEERLVAIQHALVSLANDLEATKRDAAVMARALKASDGVVARLSKAILAADERLRALEPCRLARPMADGVAHYAEVCDGRQRCVDCGVRIWPPADEDGQ